MIKLIVGAKGSGKTKRIIDMANANVETAKGTIIFLTDTDRYMYDLRYQIRTINTVHNNIKTEAELLAFIKGVLACDHDIESFYIDGAHRILGADVSDMESFYKRLDGIASNTATNFFVTVSKAEESIPEFLKSYEVL